MYTGYIVLLVVYCTDALCVCITKKSIVSIFALVVYHTDALWLTQLYMGSLFFNFSASIQQSATRSSDHRSYFNFSLHQLFLLIFSNFLEEKNTHFLLLSLDITLYNEGNTLFVSSPGCFFSDKKVL